jgi:spoIIIJ-associated protein
MTAADVAARAEELLGRMLGAMDVDVRAAARLDGEVVTIELEGPDVGVLIGGQGRTLDALQQLLVRALLRDGGAGIAIVVDAEGYRARRVEALEQLATRAAHEVLANGRSSRLAHLSARERRIVHAAAAQVAGVRSYSEGQGEERVLVIEPA